MKRKVLTDPNKTQQSLLNLRDELNCDDPKQREIYFKINSCLFSEYPHQTEESKVSES